MNLHLYKKLFRQATQYIADQMQILAIYVKKDEIFSFKNTSLWLNHHSANSLNFENTEKIWKEFKTSYSTQFRGLVYGFFSDEKEILNTQLL